MNNKISRKVLGRGLSNLIPIKVEDSFNSHDIHEISLSSLKINPYQPRKIFNEDDIRELAESIKINGLLQPIIVRQKDNFFEIISGERRFRAYQFLNRDSIPCIIKQNVSDREMLELALIENIHREDLNEIDKAVAYQKLLLEFGYTHEQLSEHVGKSRSVISNSLRLLNLPEEIQNLVRNNQISSGHARALLSLTNEIDIISVAKRITEEKLSVRDIENLSSSIKIKKKYKQNKKHLLSQEDPNLNEIINRLQYKFGTSVNIKDGSNKGTISIFYFGKDDFSRIIDLLLK